LFTAWVETVYHRRIHSETGAPPLARWHAGGPFPLPAPAALAEAFLWEAQRTVLLTGLWEDTPTWSGRCRAVDR
jgi:putative transposase